MHEDVLRRFFLGEVGNGALADDLSGSMVPRGAIETAHLIEDMEIEFEVEPVHLVKVCDAVLAGSVQPADLKAIGFCLQASDRFIWDGSSEAGSLVAETTADWSSPEVNLPLTLPNVERFRQRLVTGRDVLRSSPVA